MEQGAYAAASPVPVFEDNTQKTMRHKRAGVKRNKNKKAESNVCTKTGTKDMMLDAEVDTDTSASSGRRNSNSSSSEPEAAIFKEDDFPPLPSTVKK
jgi:hypothetical protein